MNCRLERITDWAQRAEQANWCVQTLAEQCRVSVSTLERFFRRKFGVCVHDWMTRMRMEHFANKLLEGFTVKETAFEAGYKNQQHFSREFKKYFGHPPSQHAAQALQVS